MRTPIVDFVRSYQASGTARLHMPGHKGTPFLGFESWDLTEISGADSLYEASGIIAESEGNASALFGSGKTLYSTEGATQCIRAMLHLVLQTRPAGTKPVIVAARNVHKSFVHAAALLDFSIVWLWPEGDSRGLCCCPVTPQGLERVLSALPEPPAAVYLTSPDYLGSTADIAALAKVCHTHGTLLAVDNAHGAYLRFLSSSRHPLDLGADLCCDSAHKTLPVLTGGAYLHIGKHTSAVLAQYARSAMELFGSTSPSYLTLASLDLCNAYLSGDYPGRLAETCHRIARLRQDLTDAGWHVADSDPLRLVIEAPAGRSGQALAQRLRAGGGECEYADPSFLVLMLTPENAEKDFACILSALGRNDAPYAPPLSLPLPQGEAACSVRQAIFAPQEVIPVEEALGRICGAPTVSCPPAIPIAVSGEYIGEDALALFRHFGFATVSVVASAPS